MSKWPNASSSEGLWKTDAVWKLKGGHLNEVMICSRQDTILPTSYNNLNGELFASPNYIHTT